MKVIIETIKVGDAVFVAPTERVQYLAKKRNPDVDFETVLSQFYKVKEQFPESYCAYEFDVRAYTFEEAIQAQNAAIEPNSDGKIDNYKRELHLVAAATGKSLEELKALPAKVMEALVWEVFAVNSPISDDIEYFLSRHTSSDTKAKRTANTR
jgi:hypothetical protein